MSTFDQKGKQMGFGTKAIHAGQEPDPLTGAVMPPIYQTTTYAQESPGKIKGYDYTRAGNPTRTRYEICLAATENAPFGLAFSSGMAAIDAVASTLQAGDHILCCDDVYGGTFRFFTKILNRRGIEISFIDCSNVALVEKSFKKNTKLLWLESLTNPLLKVLDIKTLSKLAKANGALTAVDNTFLTPYFQNPLDQGADIVVHSVTKYINGHSDVIGGAVVTHHQPIYEDLKFIQKSVGAVPSPLDCFLALRGLKTLHVRMQAHEKNAIEIAKFLEIHPNVSRVLYPGLSSHPHHELAQTLMRGYGGMITFFIQGGLSAAQKFLEKVKIFTLAESLGGVESLIEHPAIMTHASIPKNLREEVGITDDLIRVSVGIENLEDLKNDLAQALG